MKINLWVGWWVQWNIWERQTLTMVGIIPYHSLITDLSWNLSKSQLLVCTWKGFCFCVKKCTRQYIINLTFLHLLLLNYEIINDSLHTVLGPLFEIRFMLLRRRLDIFPELQKKLKEMENLANTQTLNEWEKKLVSVMKNFAKG